MQLKQTQKLYKLRSYTYNNYHKYNALNTLMEEQIKKSFRLLIKESQTILGISYVIAVGIGMLFTYQKYSKFGINIFDYAGVFDFLIAPFSDFRILLFTIISLLGTYLIFVLDSFYQNKFPKAYSKANFGMDKKPGYRFLRYVSTVILFLLYLSVAAIGYGNISKKRILKQADIQVKFVDNHTKNGKMIGKTKEVLFLTHHNNVDVIPITALVKEIKVRE